MGGDGGGSGECASGKRPTKEEGGTASKKARRPGGLTIREGQATGGGSSADPGAAASTEPSGKSKQKVTAEEGDGEKKTRTRKTAEAASGGEGPVGKEYDEAATFWLEYEWNDVGDIVEKELPVQLLIDPRKVCEITAWERYYNHRSLSRETVDDIKGTMLSQFREKKGKIWTKNPLVFAPIYKPVTRRPEKADRVHKDVFKPEDTDKYYYYPVNGQHTVAAVKELEGEPIFNLWKMHSWPARVVWFSDRDFAGYRQVSLNENTRHNMSKQRSQKAAFLDMREAWENEGRLPGPTDLEYSRRRNLVFAVLNGYHSAPRESVSHFLRRLEHVYFTLAEPLTLENYKSQFDEENPFDVDDMEELSDSETFDFESMPLPWVVGLVGDEEEGGPRRYSTSPASLKRVFRGEPVDDQSSDDGEEERDYDHEPCDRLPVDHDTWQNDRLYFFGKHHRFTSEDVWGRNVVWHPRIFQPAVRNGIWVMAIKEADGKWSGLKRLGAGAFKRKARTALVEHLSLMNPERNDQDVDAYAEQKLNDLYATNMLEFRAPFYALETAPSRGIDWRMPQPPPTGQNPGGGGGGDEGDGGGGGGDGSQFAGKGTGETSSVEKASGGKGSGGKGSGGKGLGGKGSGGKGSGGKCRTSGSPQYMETDPQCVGSRDSDMRDEATLTSDQVRVDSHLSARSLFPVAQESPSRHAQQRSPVLNTLLLKKGASSFCLEGGMPGLRRREGVTSGSLGSGDRHKLRIHSDLLPSPYAISAPHATVLRGQENVTSWPPHLQLDTRLPCSPPFSCVQTRDWRSRDVLEGPAPGVLEIGGSENERHTPGEDERSPGTCVVHQEEETQRWQSRKVLETGGSECERHASEGASVDTDSESAGAPGETHAVQQGEETRHGPTREDVKWLNARALVIGMFEEVLHSRSAVVTTREGVVKGGKWTSVQAPVLGDDEDEEEPAVEARVHGDEKDGEVTVDIRTDPQRKDGDSLPTHCGEEQGGRASVLSTARGMVLHEAIKLGDDSAATELVSDSGVAEMQNVESSVEGGEVLVNINMDPERKDHDSPSTRCGAEQGDRASVLSTGRKMVLHEPIDLPSDSAATELVSDTAVAEIQNLESSVDVGLVARQEGEFPQRAPEHGKICE
ncbi:hypothetical protein CBR_g37999 [Chara braunii]|uniref:Uncharacterized protein n=1 Tax=Chara braunii TaxID=69332 RepID=A0A388LP96_CHABU|nr:hypothetical protein CBR_g37999 [Chara braunii]|eukprot:GBG84124.1 hypothetical protein CBR_g37999 [Chara braunii]